MHRLTPPEMNELMDVLAIQAEVVERGSVSVRPTHLDGR